MLCSRCNLPIDDHGPEGQCPTPAVSFGEVTIYICRNLRPALAVTLPIDSTGKLAAKSVAFALDLDPEARHYRLIGPNDQPIPDDALIRHFHCSTVHLDLGT